MRRAVLGAITTLTLAAVAVILPASTASASRADCPQGSFCVWDDDDYSGPWKGWGGDDGNWHDDGWGDRAESVYNNGSPHAFDDVRVYMNINYDAADLCVVRGDYFDVGMNDNDYSSHQWVSSC
jgi:hypothetical protein